MIFTPSQWKLVAAENMAVSAAPIGPAELGQNKNYVFAIAAALDWIYRRARTGRSSGVDESESAPGAVRAHD